MSTDGQPRTREIITEAVNSLRQYQPLVEAIYRGSSIPSDLTNRQRIHEGDPGRADKPAQVAVMMIASGSTNRGGQQSTTYTIECTIECSQSFYAANSHLGLLEIRDLCGEVLDSPVAESIYPIGSAGTGSPHEIGDGGRRTLTARWRVRVHWAAY